MSWVLLGLLAVVVILTVKPRRKRNRLVRRKSDPGIHVPRETAWGRARKVYGDTQ